VTLAIAGIAAGFALWKARVDGLTATLSGVEFKGVGPADIARVNAAADAWKNLTEAVGAAAEAYNAAGAASDRHTARLNEEREAQKRLLQAQKATAMAELESRKAGLSDADYARQKIAIEDRFAAAGVQIDERGRRDQTAEKFRRMANLRSQSEAKLREAAGIRINDAQGDSANEAALKADAELAQKEIADARKQMLDRADERHSSVKQFLAMPGNVMRYGMDATYADIDAMESARIARNQPAVDRYNNFLRQKSERDALRRRRDDLTSGAARDAAEAETIRLGLPEDQAREAAANRTGRQAASLEHDARVYSAIGAASQTQQQLGSSLAQNFEATGGFNRDTVRRINALTAEVAQLRRQLTHGANTQ
jgi:hypothetical protein